MTTAKKGFSQIVGLSLISYPLGLVNQMLMSYYFGTSPSMDAYWIAITAVNAMGFYAGPVREVLIPKYFERQNDLGAEQASYYFSGVANFFLLFNGLIIILNLLFPELIISFFLSGSGSTTNHLEKLIIEYVFWFTPLIFLQPTIAILNGMLIANAKYVFQNLGQIFGTITSTICLITIAPYLGIKTLVVISILPPLTLFIYQIKELKYLKFNYHFYVKPHPDISLLKGIAYLLITYAFSQVALIYSRSTLISFGEGLVAAYQYAFNINQIPQIILIASLEAVLWSRLIKLKNSNQTENMLNLIFLLTKFTFIILGFIAVIFMIFSEQIVYLLYYRGAFTQKSLLVTSSINAILLLGMPFAGINTILIRVLLTVQKYKTVSIIGLINSIVLMAVLVYSRYLGSLSLAIFSIGISSVIGFIIAFCCVITALGKQINKQMIKIILISIFKLTLSIGLIYILGLVLVGKNIEAILSSNKIEMIFFMLGYLCLFLCLYSIFLIISKTVNMEEIQFIFGEKVSGR